MKELKGLYLSKQGDKNWGLYLINETVEKYLELKSMALSNERGSVEEGYLFNGLYPFVQSDSDPMRQFWKQQLDKEEGKEFRHDFLFIEFWTDNQELILERSLAFAKLIGNELLLEDI
jgi:hypothetical protein